MLLLTPLCAVISAVLCCAVLCAVVCVSPQVLSKEILAAVQLIESEILSSEDPLPSATLKFFMRTGRTMGQGWVSGQTNII